MKGYTVTVSETTISADMAKLLESLEPSDLDRIGKAGRLLSAFHAALAPAPQKPPAADGTLEQRVAALERQLRDADLLAQATADELAGLHGLVLSQAERTCVQSELLGRRAEAASGFVVTPATGPVAVIDDAEADLAPAAAVPSVPEPQPDPDQEPGPQPLPPQPSANGKQRGHATGFKNRLAILRSLAEGPKRRSEVAAATGITDPTVGNIMTDKRFSHLWTKGELFRSPYEITDAGRAEIAGAEAEDRTYPASAATEPPAPEPAARRTEADAAHESGAIARTIMDADEPDLYCAEIARRTGLTDEVVAHRLRKDGPQQPNERYTFFVKRESGRWGLTAAGVALAAKGVR